MFHIPWPSTVLTVAFLRDDRDTLIFSNAQNRAIDVNQLKPVVDAKKFKLEEVKEAYQYMWDQKHFGKLVIQIS